MPKLWNAEMIEPSKKSEEFLTLMKEIIDYWIIPK